MSPGNDERRPCRGAGTSSRLAGQDHSATARRQDTAAEPAGLFEIERAPAPPDVPTRVAFVIRADDEPRGQQHRHVRGPGPRRTTGPQDAEAPAWWTAEAERIVLALVAAGHTVTSDDLHERFPDEPSATGAAFGGLFARLAAAGRIAEVGWARSTRPAARKRRICVWGPP